MGTDLHSSTSPLLDSILQGTRLEVVVDKIESTSPTECYEAWLEHVWLGGGGLGPASVVTEGEARTGKGCIRRVGCCIHEEILDVVFGEHVVYHVKSGPFPVQYHRGIVQFIPEGEGCLVRWTCSYTPICCCGVIVSCTIKLSFRKMLSHLANRIKDNK